MYGGPKSQDRSVVRRGTVDYEVGLVEQYPERICVDGDIANVSIHFQERRNLAQAICRHEHLHFADIFECRDVSTAVADATFLTTSGGSAC